VGGVPVVPGHRDQRGHHHLGAGHRLRGELAVRAVLRGLEPGQARGGLPLHPRLLPLRLHHHLRVPAPPLRRRQPGDGLAVLFVTRLLGSGCASWPPPSRCPSSWAGRSGPRSRCSRWSPSFTSRLAA
jgi:hypothetical protein